MTNGTSTLGALAAIASSFTWAYASAKYASASRSIGSVRVNFARAICVAPIYVVMSFVLYRGAAFSTVTPTKAAWLAASVFCSYGLADILFFTAARILGISAALAIASIYPLWSALAGTLLGNESFGITRIIGVALCTGGVVTLVRMQSRGVKQSTHGSVAAGLMLALLTSFLWAGNTFTVKRGAVDLDVWQANAIRYSVALVWLSLSTFIGARRAPQTPTRPDGGWTKLLPAIFADCLLGSIFFVYGLSHTDLAIGATLSSLAPLVGVPIAIVVGEERWSAPRAAAVTITVAGAVLLVISAG